MEIASFGQHEQSLPLVPTRVVHVLLALLPVRTSSPASTSAWCCRWAHAPPAWRALPSELRRRQLAVHGSGITCCLRPGLFAEPSSRRKVEARLVSRGTCLPQGTAGCACQAADVTFRWDDERAS